MVIRFCRISCWCHGICRDGKRYLDGKWTRKNAYLICGAYRLGPITPCTRRFTTKIMLHIHDASNSCAETGGSVYWSEFCLEMVLCIRDPLWSAIWVYWKYFSGGTEADKLYHSITVVRAHCSTHANRNSLANTTAYQTLPVRIPRRDILTYRLYIAYCVSNKLEKLTT